jgi:endonuclease/exonuclease/phosphatase family metal-dependent hydrolase
MANHNGTTKNWWNGVVRAVAFIAVIAVANCRAGAELPCEIRVVTYNIHHGVGTDKKFGLERIAKLLMAEKPDIIALQEVDQGTKRASGVDQPAEFARLMGMKAVFGRNIPFEGGGYGTAVLTRLPIRSSKSVKLKSFYADTPKHKEQRGVQVLELGKRGEPGLLFLCTHLDYRPPDEERMNSAKTINELIRKYGGKPAIIAGDFNATPESGPIREFEKEWKVAGGDGADAKPQAAGGDVDAKDAKAILTFPADKPDRWIDYVMYRPAKKWKVVEVRVLDEAVASDHRPVLTVLRRVESSR